MFGSEGEKQTHRAGTTGTPDRHNSTHVEVNDTVQADGRENKRHSDGECHVSVCCLVIIIIIITVMVKVSRVETL